MSARATQHPAVGRGEHQSAHESTRRAPTTSSACTCGRGMRAGRKRLRCWLRHCLSEHGRRQRGDPLVSLGLGRRAGAGSGLGPQRRARPRPVGDTITMSHSAAPWDTSHWLSVRASEGGLPNLPPVHDTKTHTLYVPVGVAHCRWHTVCGHLGPPPHRGGVGFLGCPKLLTF